MGKQQPARSAVCWLLLLLTLSPFTTHLAGAQRVLRLPNPFRRSRLAAPDFSAAAVPGVVGLPWHPTPPSAPAPASSSGSGSGSPGSDDYTCPPNWALSAIGASSSGSSSSSSGTSLPASTERVLVCLISSGVHTAAPALKHNRWTGCTKEDPLDPTGCTLPWATFPSAAGFTPRGTWAASILAGSSSSSSSSSSSGIIPGVTDIHVVPVDSPASGSVDPGSTAASGKSRLRAYSVCEGRLRGLQAMDYGSSGTAPPWRMVMLVDVAADAPADSSTGDYSTSESLWVKTATGVGTPEARHAPDVLIIAPAGRGQGQGQRGLSYPAALPGVLAVGGYKCSGEPLHGGQQNPGGEDGSSSKRAPDVLAPGEGVGIPGSDALWTDDAAAAAVAAGAAARLWSAHPRCSADQIRDALRVTAGSEGQVAWLNLPAAEAALQAAGCGGSAAAGGAAGSEGQPNPTV